MNGLTKWDPFKDWDPFRELNEFQNRLRSFFSQAPAQKGREGSMLSQWSPAVDILEDDKEFVVKAELPDTKKEDVHVSVENGILSVVTTVSSDPMERLRAVSVCPKAPMPAKFAPNLRMASCRFICRRAKMPGQNKLT